MLSLQTKQKDNTRHQNEELMLLLIKNGAEIDSTDDNGRIV